MQFESIAKTLISLTSLFQDNDLQDPSADAQFLISQVTGIPQLELNLHLDRSLSVEESNRIFQYAYRRAQREPFQYIIGECCFWGFDFLLSRDVLIPRKETELLVERIIEENTERRITLLDIGTGSGNIAITIAKLRPDWIVEASDISAAALQIARQNAAHLQAKVTFYESDLLEAISKSYDIIVSNPPYIPLNEYKDLSPEVQGFEPQKALLAVEDGLFYYRKILQNAAVHLRPAGTIYFEIGYNQGERLRELAEEFNYRVVDIYKDYQQFDRIIKLTLIR